MKMTRADVIFNGIAEQGKLEDDLYDLGVLFEETSYDYYDCSIELYNVPNDYRLSEQVQRFLFDAGFLIVFLNHFDKWETHYHFYKDKNFPLKGFRVSYPNKRGKDEKGIWVEEIVPSWPKEWFKNGHVIVKEKNG